MDNTNKALAFFKSRINQPVTDAPSPFANWLNGTLRSAEEGELSFDFFVRDELTNPAGIMHGGVTAGIIDDVIGAAVYSLGRNQFYATVNFMLPLI